MLLAISVFFDFQPTTIISISSINSIIFKHVLPKSINQIIFMNKLGLALSLSE
jgi:hypothetical protein